MQLSGIVWNTSYIEIEKHFCSFCLEYATVWYYPVAASFAEKMTIQDNLIPLEWVFLEKKISFFTIFKKPLQISRDKNGDWGWGWCYLFFLLHWFWGSFFFVRVTNDLIQQFWQI